MFNSTYQNMILKATVMPDIRCRQKKTVINVLTCMRVLAVGPFPLEDTNILCSSCHHPLYGMLTHIRGSELYCDNCYRRILGQ